MVAFLKESAKSKSANEPLTEKVRNRTQKLKETWNAVEKA